ncbi:PREDICTED: bidirectional sugar transporter N3 [Acromyrmex echinatior]|uniref:bidirectional sugar transporter N3 n=1 Tax=Acromyrmex echinatior TaxID=103372 RepID=UPI00058101BA|nr:PREDICTED: bidirectional sugar transporter N3 [Acromyrmex echinatior]
MALEDYKEVVGSCAMYTTMAQMLSGTFICRNIHKKGSAKGVDPMPFLGAIGLCILMLRYAWMLGDSNMINVNIFGLLTNMIYMIIYYYYAPNTKEVLKLIYKIAVFVAIFLVYAQMEHPANVEFRFGIVVTVLLLLLIAAPLVHLKNVIKTNYFRNKPNAVMSCAVDMSRHPATLRSFVCAVCLRLSAVELPGVAEKKVKVIALLCPNFLEAQEDFKCAQISDETAA